MKLSRILIVVFFAATILIPAILSIGLRRSTEFELDIPQQALDLGDSWENSSFTRVVPVENNSSHLVSVTGVDTSCSCVSVSPKLFAVPANGKMDVELSFDARRLPPTPNIMPLNQYFSDLVLRTSSSSKKWQLTGRLKRHPIACIPQRVDLGDVVVGQAEVSEVNVRVVVPQDVNDVRFSYDESKVTVNSVASIPGSRDVMLSVCSRSTIPLGHHKFPIRLSAQLVTINDEALPDYELPVSVDIVPNVYVSPSSICFGVVSVGNTDQRQLVISERICKKGIIVDDVVSDHPSLSVDRDYSMDGYVYLVRQHFVAPGDQSHLLKILLSFADLSDRQDSLLVPVGYFGSDLQLE